MDSSALGVSSDISDDSSVSSFNMSDLDMPGLRDGNAPIRSAPILMMQAQIQEANQRANDNDRRARDAEAKLVTLQSQAQRTIAQLESALSQQQQREKELKVKLDRTTTLDGPAELHSLRSMLVSSLTPDGKQLVAGHHLLISDEMFYHLQQTPLSQLSVIQLSQLLLHLHSNSDKRRFDVIQLDNEQLREQLTKLQSSSSLIQLDCEQQLRGARMREQQLNDEVKYLQTLTTSLQSQLQEKVVVLTEKLPQIDRLDSLQQQLDRQQRRFDELVEQHQNRMQELKLSHEFEISKHERDQRDQEQRYSELKERNDLLQNRFNALQQQLLGVQQDHADARREHELCRQQNVCIFVPLLLH